jgi:lysozyme
MSRSAIFAAVRSAARPGLFDDPGNVLALDNLLDAFGVPRADAPAPSKAALKVGSKGIALMHKWEGCRLKAYPDPGSADGKPWTIGWGSTGADIGPGTVWTQEQADARFAKDLESYAAQVSKAIGGARTTQEQFDALVAFHYNTGKIGTATLTKRHLAGDFEGAALEFRKWVMNDGKRMQGLVNRRADEERLYRSSS